jgi:hypothetical protein
MATEADFLAALRTRFPEREYALLPQVRNQTGFGAAARTADALAVSLWPSRGIDAHGFEFKDSRSDWQKELADSSKSEEIGRFCAHWWLVVSDAAIVKPGELPNQWGLIALSDGGTRVVTKAPRRNAEPPGWEFVASVLRAAAKVHPDEAVRKKEEAAHARGRDQGFREGKEYGGKHAADELARLAKQVAAFEQASGVRLDRYSEPQNKRIGGAVQLVLSNGFGADVLAGYAERFRNLADAAERAARDLRESPDAG